MTPEQLKSSILQYAIQGKLVEQRAEEGTGEELYKKILAEKQRLIKEGKIKKEKILPEISEDEVPFNIPESWKWVRLGDVVYNHGQKKPNKKFSYIDIGSIDNKKQKINEVENIVEADNAPSRARKIVKGGDIIYATVRPYLHNMCIVDSSKFTCEPIASTGFAVMSCYDGIYNKYLFYYLLSPFFDSFANDTNNSKGVAYPSINDDRLFRGILMLPPLAEQKRIVNKIEELIPYVEKYALNYEKLEKLNTGFPDDMKKSILQHAIQGKLVEQRAGEGTGEELYKEIQAEKQRLIKEGKIKREKVLPEINDDEIPFDIPDSWKWVRWGELSFSIQYGYNAPAKISGRIKMVRITDIQNGVIDWDNVPFCDIDEKDIDKYKLAENDILFARTGGTVGKSYIVRDILEESIYAGYLIRTRYSNMLDPMYLYYFMQTNLYWNQLRAGTISTAQPNCNGQTLSKMIIPLPPIIEQQRIVSKVEELLQYINIIK